MLNPNIERFGKVGGGLGSKLRLVSNEPKVSRSKITRWRNDQPEEKLDSLTIEEPFEIQVAAQGQPPRPLAAIMRTPGNDQELAAGFLVSEGVIDAPDDIIKIEGARDDEGEPIRNTVVVTLAPHIQPNEDNGTFERHFQVASSCGLCGKTTISDILQKIEPLPLPAFAISPQLLYSLPDILRQQQEVFEQTGGLHAAGLFDLDGHLLYLREDVGRHNAVDKIVGRATLDRKLPLSQNILLVSGRASFEIIQKALVARIPIVAAVSAPSSLSVDLAQQGGLTLIAFLRGQNLNVYTWPERIKA